MTTYRGQRGVAMASAMMILLLLVPLLLAFMKRSQILARLSTRERINKTSRSLAVNSVLDYMRQFSNSPQDDHMDTVALSRTETFYDAGFTDASVAPDFPTRSLLVTARGLYGQDSSSAKQTKNLRALIRFVSDMTLFATIFNVNWTNGTGNLSFDGGTWVEGSKFMAGGNHTFNNGPVVITGTLDMTGGGSVTVNNGDLYVGGGGTVANCFNPGGANPPVSVVVNGGRIIRSVPQGISPIFKPNMQFFQEHRTYISGLPFERWVFYSTGTMDVFDAAGVWQSQQNLIASPKGAVLFAPNTRLFIQGLVRGHVTIYCSKDPAAAFAGDPGPLPLCPGKNAYGACRDNVDNESVNVDPVYTVAGVNVGGVVKIALPFKYADGTVTASAQNSLAVIADNMIIVERTPASTVAGDFTIPGVINVRNPSNPNWFFLRIIKNTAAPNTPMGGVFLINGVRCARVTNWGTPNVSWATPWINLDTNLSIYPPPGLPERPVMTELDFQ